MLVRRSSSIGRMLVHLCFKVKYCHRIFDDKRIETRCAEVFYGVARRYGLTITELGFDKDHVHMIVDIGLRSIPDVAKLLKGTSGKFLLKEFPLLKSGYFWNSGLWGSQTYFDSVGQNLDELSKYVRYQGSQ